MPILSVVRGVIVSIAAAVTGGDPAPVASDPFAAPQPSAPVQPGMPPGGAYWTLSSAVVTPPVDRADFLTTGHSLFVILFALLGGVITRRCSRPPEGRQT